MSEFNPPPQQPPAGETSAAAPLHAPASTSNVAGDSPARPSRWRRALVLVLMTLAALEVFTRVKLYPASKDFAKFLTYPQAAARLMAAPGPHVALVGNSTTQHGIDVEQLSQELHVTADAFYADASKIDTWHYLTNHYFWRENREPELLIVTFYENNLIDGNRIEIGRLAQFFTKRSDWSELFAHELRQPRDQAEFVLCSYWATLASRSRIKQRVMKAIVPDYEEYSQAINRLERQRQRVAQPNTGETAATATNVTHDTLRRLMARAAQHHSHICFVAFPTRDCAAGAPYSLRDETTAEIRAAGMDFIDLRQVADLTTDHYADDLHLTSAGRSIYTRHLAQALQPLRESLTVSSGRAGQDHTNP